MGVNAQTAVPTFTASQVLTAAQQNQINTGIPVFATTTTRDAAFGGSGQKTLAQGQYAFIEASNATQYYNGSSWVTVGAAGLTYITAATPSAVNTISVNNCFSSTYQNYRLIFNFSAASTNDSLLTFRLRASGTDTTANYKGERLLADGGTATATLDPSGTDDWYLGNLSPTVTPSTLLIMDLVNPFSTTYTGMFTTNFLPSSGAVPQAQIIVGGHNANTSYDGFTVNYAGTTMTGTIRVYGYSNS